MEKWGLKRRLFLLFAAEGVEADADEDQKYYDDGGEAAPAGGEDPDLNAGNKEGDDATEHKAGGDGFKLGNEETGSHDKAAADGKDEQHHLLAALALSFAFALKREGALAVRLVLNDGGGDGAARSRDRLARTILNPAAAFDFTQFLRTDIGVGFGHDARGRRDLHRNAAQD